jgi:hypothetical protein
MITNCFRIVVIGMALSFNILAQQYLRFYSFRVEKKDEILDIISSRKL